MTMKQEISIVSQWNSLSSAIAIKSSIFLVRFIMHSYNCEPWTWAPMILKDIEQTEHIAGHLYFFLKCLMSQLPLVTYWFQ